MHTRTHAHKQEVEAQAIKDTSSLHHVGKLQASGFDMQEW